MAFLALLLCLSLQDPPRARYPPSPGVACRSVRHPLAGCPVERYICPVKQEALMNAAPWTPACDPCPGRCALPDRQAVGGVRGQWVSEGRTAGFLLPCFLTCYFSLWHSKLSESRPCSWPTVMIVRSGVGKPEPMGRIWFTACSYMAFKVKIGFYIFKFKM